MQAAPVDFDAIGMAKTTADPAGHYARPDVARLLLCTAPAMRVVPMAGRGRLSLPGSWIGGSGPSAYLFFQTSIASMRPSSPRKETRSPTFLPRRPLETSAR